MAGCDGLVLSILSNDDAELLQVFDADADQCVADRSFDDSTPGEMYRMNFIIMTVNIHIVVWWPACRRLRSPRCKPKKNKKHHDHRLGHETRSPIYKIRVQSQPSGYASRRKKGQMNQTPMNNRLTSRGHEGVSAEAEPC